MKNPSNTLRAIRAKVPTTTPAIAPPDRPDAFCELDGEGEDVAGATTGVLVLKVVEADVDEVVATDVALVVDNDDDGAASAAVEKNVADPVTKAEPCGRPVGRDEIPFPPDCWLPLVSNSR